MNAGEDTGGRAVRINPLSPRSVPTPSARIDYVGVLRLGGALWTAAISTLYAVDVTVNLTLGEQLFAGDPIVASWRDFLGLLLAEVPVTFGCAIASLIAGSAFAATLRRRSPGSEATIALSAAISVLTILSSTNSAWNFSSSQIPLATAIAMTVGMLNWFFLRWAVPRNRGARVGIQQILTPVAFPSLIMAFGSLTAARFVQNRSADAIVDLGCTLLVLFLLFVAILAHAPEWKLTAATVSVATSIPIALLACTSTIQRLETPVVERSNSLPHRPNIIMIVLDTVRADHLKRYGYHRNTMPALEIWADTALVARRAVSPAGWTTPAHASIMSGLPVSLHGIHEGPRNGPFTTTAFKTVRWLPSLLRQEGYYCLAISANTLAIAKDVAGFHRKISPQRNQWTRATIAALVEHYAGLHNTISERLRWRTPYADARDIVDITLRAVPAGDHPLFLFVNLLDAHSPYNPPTDALARLGVDPPRNIPRYLSHRELTLRWPSLPGDRQKVVSDLYDGELRWIDLHLERFLAWLGERFGHNSLVIITSDHGEELGEEGRVGHEYGLSQRLIHVPLFIKSPYLRSGNLETTLSLRGLYEFILQSARGANPGIRALATADGFGVISERYPSGINGSTLGSDYERPWVALFEDGVKGVGPSAYGTQVLDVSSAGFDREIPISDEGVISGMLEKIDRFWETHRDVSREKEEPESPSKEDLMKLRSLGYVD